jgi:hypothetical protein
MDFIFGNERESQRSTTFSSKVISGLTQKPFRGLRIYTKKRSQKKEVAYFLETAGGPGEAARRVLRCRPGAAGAAADEYDRDGNHAASVTVARLSSSLTLTLCGLPQPPEAKR